MACFFFSSRRRHTRLQGDWSSDVCSSDLEPQTAGGRGDPEAGDGFLREGDPVNCYPFIEAEKAQQRNVKRACELLKVSRAAFYAARCGQPSGRDRQDAELTTRIKAEHKRSRGRYGSPRIHAELRSQGPPHSP